MLPAAAAVLPGLIEAACLVEPHTLRLLAVNPAMCVLTGRDEAQLLAMTALDLASTSEDVFFWEAAARGEEQRIRSESLLARPDGEVRQVERAVSWVDMPGGPAVFLWVMVDRSAQVRAEQVLENIIAELRATLESTADGILVTDIAGHVRGCNQRFAELWDIPPALLAERNDDALFNWLQAQVMDGEVYRKRLDEIREAPLLEGRDVLHLHSGRVLERVTLPQFARGNPIGRVYSFHDITRRLADEARLKLASQVFECSLDAVFVTDADLRFLAVNPTFERLSGWSSAEIIGTSAELFISTTSLPGPGGEIGRALETQGVWQGELWTRRKNGEAFPCLLSMVKVREEAQSAAHYIAFAKDLTDTLEARRRIEQLAFNDTLTGLPNRLLLRERCELAISHAKRDRGTFALLFVDLDRFKQINDSLGHAIGDRVLKAMAWRLRSAVRQIDTAARLGGDEFIILLNQADAAGAEVFARRLLTSIMTPLQVEDMTFSLTGSIGIAMYPDDGADLDELIRNADSAMYAVKGRTRGDVRFYQRDMNVGLLSRMKLDHALRRAIENRELKPHFQPKFSIDGERLIGAEALVRWHSPELGPVSPGQFIPVAEESGAIVQLGTLMLEDSLAQAAEWRRRGARIPIAVNVSAMQFRQDAFLQQVDSLLQRYQLPGDALELELTESILVGDAEEATWRLRQLNELGVRLAIDDFGTGYSSLSYLKRFPIERIKIDRSFVVDVPENPESCAIVQAIIQMGRALSLSVTAEGVETVEQRQFLQRAGCHEMQGWLVSPALAAPEFEARFLASSPPST